MTNSIETTFSGSDYISQLKTRADAVLFGATYEGDDCVLWPFYIGDKGYGHTRHEGTRMLASRAVCLTKRGQPVDASAQAAHSCHNTSCVNGRHLHWKTVQENMAEKVAAGRQPRGTENIRAKVSEEAVVEMRRLWGALTTRELAAMFGLAHGTVHRIVARTTWVHVL